MLDPVPIVTSCDGGYCVREGFKELADGGFISSLYSRDVSEEHILVHGEVLFSRGGPGSRMRYRIEVPVERSRRPDLEDVQGFCFDPRSWSLVFVAEELVFRGSPKLSLIDAEASLLPAGDANSDGLVNGSDLGIVLDAWSSEDSSADLNMDGRVDGADLSIVLGTWGM